jgi:hypothetical protein
MASANLRFASARRRAAAIKISRLTGMICHQLSSIERIEERGQHSPKDRIPLKRIDEDVGVEIDTPGQR